MQLHIRHQTLYRYEEPVKRSVQNLRLTPRRDQSQHALTWRITAPGRSHSQIDAHGNVVHLLTVDEPHREIRIVVDGIVETSDTEGVGVADDGRLSPLAYLADTPLTKADEALRDFARRQMQGAGKAGMLDLASEVCEAIKYEKGSTDVNDSAAQAFTRGRGVCQDHAHVFIACCRAMHIPVRYVSGYFYPGKEDRIESHAWVDVWQEEQKSWLGVDVTHRAFTGGRYCRLAVGRDYLDACPVRGVRRGGGGESMEVAVWMATSAQQQQQQ
jgi:transglutaminase-like putative cysteine protease